MLAAFITGFAEQAKEEIDKTNKEISDRVIAGMASAIKKREAALEAAKEREDKGREQVRALNALSGNKLTQSQIIGILHSGEADTVIESLRKQSVGPEKLKRLFIPADKDAQADLEQYITDLGRLTGQAPARTEMERGAFGIQTRAGEAAKARGLAQAAPMGITEENLYQTKAVTPAGVEGSLDLSVFAKPETTEALKTSMRDIIARSDKTNKGIVSFANEEDEKQFDTIKKQIEAAAIVKGMFSFEEEKPRTSSQINTIFKNTLREGLDPYVISGVAIVRENGDVDPVTGDPDDIAKFRASRNKIIREIAINRGLLDPKTNEVLDREAEDSLSAFAVIEDGKIVKWKTNTTPYTPSGSAKPAAATPEAATLSKPKKVKVSAISRNQKGQYVVTDPRGVESKFRTEQEAKDFIERIRKAGG